jgi:mRNA turnover protein 4
VEEMFGLHEEEDFARPGQVATQTVTMPIGPVTMPDTGAAVAHTLEPTLRKNGMPTKLNHGVVELIAPFTLCTEGKPLDPKQCALLRTFNLKMASFTLVLDSVWEDGEVKVLSEPGDDEHMDAPDPELDYGLDASMMLPPGM